MQAVTAIADWQNFLRNRELGIMRERLEVIRAFLIPALELQAVSHHTLADLNGRLDELGKQATRRQQWFLMDESIQR
jgi:hypothetical protein